MPLMDHFHPPLYPRRHWEGLHTRWASALADALNQDLLPADFFAEPQIHFGARVEIDVATLEAVPSSTRSGQDGSATATVASPAWAPPAPPVVLPAVFPGTFAVRVFGTGGGGLDLVAAIELVSPGNKDRPEARRAFAIKSASYLCQGISLIIMDIVTGQRANLHNAMIELLQADEASCLPAEAALYAVAYRPVRRNEKEEIDVWPTTLALGAPLPLLPLGLTRGACVPVDFEAAYTEACRRLRLI
jgi:hypothetical protein